MSPYVLTTTQDPEKQSSQENRWLALDSVSHRQVFGAISNAAAPFVIGNATKKYNQGLRVEEANVTCMHRHPPDVAMAHGCIQVGTCNEA